MDFNVCRDRGNSRFQQSDTAQDQTNPVAHQTFRGHKSQKVFHPPNKKKIKTNKSGRYMHIFGYLWKHTGQTGNQAVCCQNTVMSRQRRNGEHTLPWTTDFPCSWDNRNPTPSSSSGALCTSEWGSISSCWQTRLQSILEEEAVARSVAGFPRSVPPGGKTGIKSGCPRLTFSHLSPGLVW